MTYYTGRDGSLFQGDTQIARVQTWSITAQVEPIETTDLGSNAREYVPGVKNATGTATIFYYLDAPKSLISKVLKTGAPNQTTDPVAMSLRWGPKRLDFTAVLTQVDITCQIGEAMQAQISFNVTGDMTTITL